MHDRRKDAQKLIAQNRAATFHFVISERYEAGIVLRGSEVKSLCDGRVDITDAYASIDRGEVWLRQMHIASFFAARAFPHDKRAAIAARTETREALELVRAHRQRSSGGTG